MDYEANLLPSGFFVFVTIVIGPFFEKCHLVEMLW